MTIFLGNCLMAVAPNWSVDASQFEYNATVTAVVKIEGAEVQDSNDVLSAFVGEQCRGVVKPTETLNSQMFFLLVYSNSNNDTLSFKIYDSSKDMIFASQDSIIFEAGKAYGSADDPFLILANELVGIKTNPERPDRLELWQNYPNPFNSSTIIQYEMNAASHVKLIVYNLEGKVVQMLINEFQNIGKKKVVWNGKDTQGRAVSNGIYIYKLVTNKAVKTKKMILLK